MSNQSDRILSYLRTGAKLTPLKALKMGFGMRLSGRVYDLRERGYNIKSRRVSVGKAKVAEYSL